MQRLRSFRPDATSTKSRTSSGNGLNEVVGLDTLWFPCVRGGKKLALNIIDWASHFQMVIPVRSANPEAIWIAFQQWTRLWTPAATLC